MINITQINPAILILLVSFAASLISILATKFFTDQKKMKNVKEEVKGFQNDMKAHKNNPKKLSIIQKELMNRQMWMMTHSFRPMFVTFLPLILILAWLSATVAFEPIMPGQEFSVFVETSSDFNVTTIPSMELIGIEKANNGAIVKLKAENESSYTIWYSSGNEKASNDVIVSSMQKYEKPQKKFGNSVFKQAVVQMNALKPLGDVSIFGWMPGWLGIYVISALVFTIVLRKILNVH